MVVSHNCCGFIFPFTKLHWLYCPFTLNNEDNKLAVFQGKHIRKVFHEDEWWFSIIDVIEVLVGGDRPRKYWSDLKNKLISEGYIEVSEKIGQLKMQAPDGKMRLTDCANTETLFRIIQSIPSPKVEPLKPYFLL